MENPCPKRRRNLCEIEAWISEVKRLATIPGCTFHAFIFYYKSLNRILKSWHKPVHIQPESWLERKNMLKQDRQLLYFYIWFVWFKCLCQTRSRLCLRCAATLYTDIINTNISHPKPSVNTEVFEVSNINPSSTSTFQSKMNKLGQIEQLSLNEQQPNRLCWWQLKLLQIVTKEVYVRRAVCCHGKSD